MKEKTKQERIQKLQAAMNAARDHLKNGLRALENANLYTNDAEEKAVDALTVRLEKLIQDMM